MALPFHTYGFVPNPAITWIGFVMSVLPIQNAFWYSAWEGIARGYAPVLMAARDTRR